MPDSRPRWRILSPGQRVPLCAHGPSSLRPVERSSTRLVAIFNISKIRDWNIFFCSKYNLPTQRRLLFAAEKNIQQQIQPPLQQHPLGQHQRQTLTTCLGMRLAVTETSPTQSVLTLLKITVFLLASFGAISDNSHCLKHVQVVQTL